MIIKKFTGKNEDEATRNARAELGVNVVIMNVRSIKKGGLFGFLKPPACEVTVALEEENEREIIQEKAIEKSNENVREALSEINRVVAKNDAVSGTEKSVRQTPVRPAENNTPKQEQQPQERRENRTEQAGGGSAIEEKLDSLQNLLEQQIENKEKKVAQKTDTPAAG